MLETANADRTEVMARASAPSAIHTADVSKRVTELQVSGHLMTLEAGLFCIFQAPGAKLPDPATGLPNLSITNAPGLDGRPEAVSISTFREGGRPNSAAALVRVTDGSAQILVTIYQQKGQDAAPRLQVLRLNGEPNVPEPQTVAPATAVKPSVNGRPAWTATDVVTGAPVQTPARPAIMAHVQRLGDVGGQFGEWLGVKGSRQWVEGFGIAPLNGVDPEDLEYQAILGRNWLSPWVVVGKFCGSRGMALPLLGLKVRLKGTAAKKFDCICNATFVDGSAVGPVYAGQPCEAESLAALEAFQIVIQPLGKAAPKATLKKTAPSVKTAQKPLKSRPSS